MNAKYLLILEDNQLLATSQLTQELITEAEVGLIDIVRLSDCSFFMEKKDDKTEVWIPVKEYQK